MISLTPGILETSSCDTYFLLPVTPIATLLEPGSCSDFKDLLSKYSHTASISFCAAWLCITISILFWFISFYRSVIFSFILLISNVLGVLSTSIPEAISTPIHMGCCFSLSKLSMFIPPANRKG